ncbi:MAG: hypothetical protein ACM3N9_03205 [Syntrophothermus sp.]
MSQEDLFNAIITKASLKQDVYSETLTVFNKMKAESHSMVTAYQQANPGNGHRIPFEFSDHGPFEFEIKFGGDVLIFFMHSNIFDFSRDHEVMRSQYIRDDKNRSYCGIIHIFNFLADSFRYNRINDLGYLIGRVFVNREKHYFIEGKREIGQLYNNFATSVMDDEAVLSIISSAIRYTLNFDLLTPPFDSLKEVSVMEMKNTIDSIQIRTAKRLGYRFQADKVEEEG